MSESNTGSVVNKCIDFEPILPETGLLFYEECPQDCIIERPKLLPLKTPTQLRLEQVQHEAGRLWKERGQKSADQK